LPAALMPVVPARPAAPPRVAAGGGVAGVLAGGVPAIGRRCHAAATSVHRCCKIRSCHGVWVWPIHRARRRRGALDGCGGARRQTAAGRPEGKSIDRLRSRGCQGGSASLDCWVPAGRRAASRRRWRPGFQDKPRGFSRSPLGFRGRAFRPLCRGVGALFDIVRRGRDARAAPAGSDQAS
jgi:hypothetical protein